MYVNNRDESFILPGTWINDINKVSFDFRLSLKDDTFIHLAGWTIKIILLKWINCNTAFKYLPFPPLILQFFFFVFFSTYLFTLNSYTNLTYTNCIAIQIVMYYFVLLVHWCLCLNLYVCLYTGYMIWRGQFCAITSKDSWQKFAFGLSCYDACLKANVLQKSSFFFIEVISDNVKNNLKLLRLMLCNWLQHGIHWRNTNMYKSLILGQTGCFIYMKFTQEKAW